MRGLVQEQVDVREGVAEQDGAGQEQGDAEAWRPPAERDDEGADETRLACPASRCSQTRPKRGVSVRRESR